MLEMFYKSIRGNKLQKIKKYRSGCLVVVENLDEDDIEKVSKLTGFDQQDLLDIFDLYEIPRIERHKEGILLYVRNPSTPQQGLHTELLTLLVTAKDIVMLSKQGNALLKDHLKVLSVVTTQRTKLVLHFLNIIAKKYTREIKKVSDEVLRQKRELHLVSDKDVTVLVKNEDILNQYLTALVPMKNVFEIISKGKVFDLYEDDADLLEDVLLSINQSVSICEVNLKTIVALRDAYQIIFTNKLNGTMKFLASFTIIVTIPNIIAGLFGMNVHLPLENHPIAFMLIIQIIFVSCLAVAALFYQRRWL